MSGGPWDYATSGTGNLADVLSTVFMDDVVTQMNRAVVPLQVLGVRTIPGKNISWVPRFSQSAYYAGAIADGDDVSGFDSDYKAHAVLDYTTYHAPFAIGGRAQSAAAAAGNPAELANLVGEEITEAGARLAKAVGNDIYSGRGPTTYNEMTGLYAVTTTSYYGALTTTQTYAGLSRSTYTEWAANVDVGSSVNRALTVTLMRDMMRTIYTASGEKPDLILTDPYQFERYAELLGPQRVYYQDVNTAAGQVHLDGGIRSLRFDGIPVVEDALHPANTMTFLNTAHTFIAQLPFTRIMQNDEGEMAAVGTPEAQFGAAPEKLRCVVKHLAESGDVLKLALYCYPQIVCRRPNACGSIQYLAS